MRRKKLSSLLWVAIVLIFVAYVFVAMVNIQAEINRQKALQEELWQKLEGKRVVIVALEEDIAFRDTDDARARFAREKLGMVIPGEKRIINRTP